LADVPGAVTPAVLDQVLARRIADYGLARYANDFKLLLLSWVYDLNTLSAARMLKNSGQVEEIIALLPPAPGTATLAAQIRADLDAAAGGATRPGNVLFPQLQATLPEG
jgi:hypothetical protein